MELKIDLFVCLFLSICKITHETCPWIGGATQLISLNFLALKFATHEVVCLENKKLWLNIYVDSYEYWLNGASGVSSVTYFLTIHEQTQLNRVCNFHFWILLSCFRWILLFENKHDTLVHCNCKQCYSYL